MERGNAVVRTPDSRSASAHTASTKVWSDLGIPVTIVLSLIRRMLGRNRDGVNEVIHVMLCFSNSYR